MVPIAVKALVKMATIVEPLVPEPEILMTPQIAARTMVTSPAATTHIPVQARVRSTTFPEGLVILVKSPVRSGAAGFAWMSVFGSVSDGGVLSVGAGPSVIEPP